MAEEPNEKIVDVELNKFLQTELPVYNERDIHVDGEEFQVEDESKKIPISDSTKNKILHYLKKGVGDGLNVLQMNKFIHDIEELTETDAQRYLYNLQHVNAENMDGHLLTEFLTLSSEIFFNPSKPDVKKAAINDKFVRECVSDMMMDVFGQLGSWAGVAFYLLYAISSWRDEKKIELALDPKESENKKN